MLSIYGCNANDLVECGANFVRRTTERLNKMLGVRLGPYAIEQRSVPLDFVAYCRAFVIYATLFGSALLLATLAIA